jgi:hypothetical protein
VIARAIEPRQRVVNLMFIAFLLYISAAELRVSLTGASTCSRPELAHAIARIPAIDFKGIARSFAARDVGSCRPRHPRDSPVPVAAS